LSLSNRFYKNKYLFASRECEEVSELIGQCPKQKKGLSLLYLAIRPYFLFSINYKNSSHQRSPFHSVPYLFWGGLIFAVFNTKRSKSQEKSISQRIINDPNSIKNLNRFSFHGATVLRGK